MPEILFVFFVFAIITGFVMILGHGLWLLTAAVFRALFGIGRDPAVHGERCPNCNGRSSLLKGTCADCGYRTITTRRADLQAGHRLIRQLKCSGRLSDSDFQAVSQALTTEAETLGMTGPFAPWRAEQADPRATAAPPRNVPDAESESVETTKPAVDQTDSAAAAAATAPLFEIKDDENRGVETLDAEIVDPEPATPFMPTSGPQPQRAPHPLDALEPEEAVPARSFSPRRTIADMLQTFMEEKNIRWGELASGMLIVGSAIGLVVSLRVQLRQLSEQVPYLPALLLMLGTVAIHAAGLYTLRRWNLRSTSRGVLIIATLLVPLSFAAGIMLSGVGDHQAAVGSPIYIAAVLVGMLGYGVVTSLSARALFPVGWWRLTVAVMGTSAGQLIINRMAGEETSTKLLDATALFALPLVSYLVATLSQLTAISAKPRLSPHRAAQTFTVLGIAAFALAVPLVLQAGISAQVRATIASLSPSLSVAAAVVLSIGITVQRRCESKRMGETRMVGTALALLGGMLMLGTVFAAWPNPTTLIAVATVTAITLVTLAIVGRLPILHSGAVAAASFAGLLYYHHATGRFDIQDGTRGIDLIRAVLMGRSAVLLLVPVLLSGLAGLLLIRKQRTAAGRVYLASAAGIATLTLAIAFYAGFLPMGEDPNWTTAIFILYAAGALTLIPILKRQAAAWVGSAALLVAMVHLLWGNTWLAYQMTQWHVSPARPLLLAVLLYALAVAIHGLVLHLHGLRKRAVAQGDDRSPYAWLQPLPLSGALAAALCVPFILNLSAGAFGDHGAYAACVAVTWAIAASLLHDARLATAAQAAATVAIGLVTAAIAKRQDWSHGLNDLRHFQLQLSVLGIWCMSTSAVRSWCDAPRRKHPGVTSHRSDGEQHGASFHTRVLELLKPAWPSVDQIVLGALVAVIAYIGVNGCWAGVSVELGMLSALEPAAQDTWHQVAYASGSWIALGCIVGALLLSLYEKLTVTRLAGLVAAMAVIPLLVSGLFEDSQAVASALRWSFALHGLTWITVITVRNPIKRLLARTVPATITAPANFAQSARDLATLLSVLPVVLLTTVAVVQVGNGVTLGGPASVSLFGRMSPALLYATPLALLVIGMLVIAVRDGSTQFALLGSLLLQFVVALAVLLPTFQQGNYWSIEVTILLLQWSVCSLAAYALIWQALSQWIDRHIGSTENWQFAFQLIATSVAAMVLAAWPFGVIFLNAGTLPPLLVDLGLWPSYLATALASLALLWHFRNVKRALAVLSVVVPCAFATLVAATSNSADSAGNWLAYHVLTGGYLAVALGSVAVAWRQSRGAGDSDFSAYLGRSAMPVAAGIFMLLVRGCVHDPIVTWWTLGISTGLVLFFFARAVQSRRNAHGYLAALVVSFATSVIWCHLASTRSEQFLTGFFHANVIAASLLGICSLALEQWYQGKWNEPLAPHSRLAPIHRFLAVASTMILFIVGVGGAMASVAYATDIGIEITNAWSIAALLVLGVFLIGLWWEQHIGLNLVTSYFWGYIAIALALNLLQRTTLLGLTSVGSRWTVVGAALAGAVYIALTGHLWKWGANIARWATRLRVPRPIEKLESISRWLPIFNLIVMFLICGLGFVTIFTFDQRAMRVTVAFAPLLLAYGMSCLAQQDRKFFMQCMALFLVVVGAVFIGWADVTVFTSTGALLAYAARLLVVLAGMTLLYSLVVTRGIGSTSDWFDAVRRSSVVLAAATVTILASVLMLEVMLFRKGIGAPIATPEVIAISIMLFGLLAALLSMAVLPGRDPLGLTDKGRQGYVYAAQAIAALLFAHIYLAKPKLFELGLLDYWPYLVMGISFASVAFAEFCFRKGWQVIAEPMQRTGGFLPLLPALTAWTFSSSSSYPLVLFFAGLIYVFMSVSRRSFVAGIAAAVMGNGALWALFREQGLQLTTQPQLWMIPPALSVLGASYINRDRLSDKTMTAIRYICVMIIYLSSTGEMFMKLMPEDAHDWGRPLILTSLSVAGIFAGIMLRVRAFLYLGSSFLLLSIVAMVWNAQRIVGHTWPWWAFGISLGLVILIIFGLFEKHRKEVEQLITRLRQWAP